MSERIRRRREDGSRQDQKAGIPRGSSGSRGGGSSNGIPKGSSSGSGGGGGSGIPKGSSGGSHGSGGSGIPKGSSSGGGSRGGSGIPRGASIRRGKTGGAGIPRGSKEDDQQRWVKDNETATGGVETKADGMGTTTQVANKSEGIVEAIVSVTGLEDNVKDIVLPGAYEKTLKKRMPKIVWAHQWNSPVAKVLDIKELMPGDSELPKTLSNGDPWPSDAGALFAKMQFNLEGERGKQAFSDVSFYGDTNEWSIGFSVPAGKAKKDAKSGIRKIEELELFECSPVLHGAMSHARTRSIKSLDEAKAALAEGGYDTSDLDSLVESKDARQGEAFDGLLASEVKDLVQAHAIIGAYLTELGVKTTAVEGDPDLATPDDDERWVNSEADDGPMSLYGELEQLLDPDDFADLLELAAEFDDASDEGDPDVAGEVMSELLDVFEAEEAEDEELTALRDVIADVLEDRWPEAAGDDDEDDDELAEDDDAYYDESEDESEDDVGEDYDAEGEAEEAEPEPAAEKSHRRGERKEISQAERDKASDQGHALSDGTYPVRNARELQSAIRLRTQGNAPNKVVDDHIKKRANALNLSHMLPDSMTAGNKKKSSEKSAALSEVKALPSMSWGSDEVGSLVVDAIKF